MVKIEDNFQFSPQAETFFVQDEGQWLIYGYYAFLLWIVNYQVQCYFKLLST